MKCRHAQFRRHLSSTGVQTRARELADVGAALMLDRESKCRDFSEVRRNDDFFNHGSVNRTFMPTEYVFEERQRQLEPGGNGESSRRVLRRLRVLRR